MSDRHPARRYGPAVAALLGVSIALAGCGEMRAERQGRQLGDAICDVKQADSLEEAEQQLPEVEREMDDLRRIVGRPINEDIDDIDENLTDLLQHAADDNDVLMDQDIAVIQRNIDAVRRGLAGEAQAAYDGIEQGLGACDY